MYNIHDIINPKPKVHYLSHLQALGKKKKSLETFQHFKKICEIEISLHCSLQQNNDDNNTIIH